MKSAFAIVALAAAASLLGGCDIALVHPTIPESHAASVSTQGEWITGPVDARRTTALVRALPPAGVRETFERVAARTDLKEFGAMLHARAQGGFGSGAVMIRKENGKAVPYVVTNRHVVLDSDTVEVAFADGTSYRDCEVLYVNPDDDVAVVQLPEGAARAIGYGLAPSTAKMHERQVVVAAGYPGVGGAPSFQITEGKVSNASFSVPGILDEGRPLIQHTASIDPGSSGGPLTTEDGSLVGLNVALLRTRQNVNLSVPVESVLESVQAASVLRGIRGSRELMTARLRETCDRLAGEMSTSNASATRMGQFVSNAFVAREGYGSFIGYLRLAPAQVLAKFVDEPMSTMRTSVGLRIGVTGSSRGSGQASCAAVNPADARDVGTGRPIRMGINTASGLVELSWTFEHGHWRVLSGTLTDLNQLSDTEEAQKTSPAERTSAKAKSAKRGASPK